jgi:hypothetical protein
MRDFQEEFDESQEDDYELWLEMMLNDSRAAHKATLRVYNELNKAWNKLTVAAEDVAYGKEGCIYDRIWNLKKILKEASE